MHKKGKENVGETCLKSEWQEGNNHSEGAGLELPRQQQEHVQRS